MNDAGTQITEAEIAITTSLSSDDGVVSRAVRVAGELGCPFLERSDASLDEIRIQTGRDYLLVFTATEVRLVTTEDTLWFHPNMASARIEAIRRGEVDRFACYLDLQPGDRVLDATCGLGSDAIVTSHVVGPGGVATALEKSTVLATIVREGMQTYVHRTPEVEDAMRRVEVIAADSNVYLSSSEDRSWDVVYLDPMFEGTLALSQGLELVRRLAHDDAVTRVLVQEARRLARRYVVMKDRAPGRQLEALGFSDISRKGKIYYGRITSSDSR